MARSLSVPDFDYFYNFIKFNIKFYSDHIFKKVGGIKIIYKYNQLNTIK